MPPSGRALPIATLCALLAAACTTTAKDAHPAALVERSHMTMGSELTVTIWTADETSAASASEAVFHEFDRLEALMTVWREDSDIQRLNRAAGDHPVRVSPEVREVLTAARRVSELTEGKFDVTFGALSGLWKFDHDQDNTVPERQAVLKQLPLVDYRELVVDDGAGTAFLRKRGMRAHLGGIGKGYAVDRGVGILKQRGFRDFMIQAGGDMFVAGKRGDRSWRVGIRDPRGPAEKSFAALDLTEGTFSTSGDYERFFMKNGRRYHHILDLSRGEPATGCRSVTIVADNATVTDALAKGVFVMGPERGMALIERLPHVDGVIVSSKNEVLISSGLRNRLILLAPPTDAP
jgi:thiamine biosynthesis lipoprotein